MSEFESKTYTYADLGLIINTYPPSIYPDYLNMPIKIIDANGDEHFVVEILIENNELVLRTKYE